MSTDATTALESFVQRQGSLAYGENNIYFYHAMQTSRYQISIIISIELK